MGNTLFNSANIYLIAQGVLANTTGLTAFNTFIDTTAGRAINLGSDRTVLNNLAPTSRNLAGIHSSIVVQGTGANIGSTGILAGGNFPGMAAGNYVMKRVTTSLAGVTNTFLRSGGSSQSSRRSIAKRESVRSFLVATAIRAGNWSIFSGTFSSTPTAQNDIGLWAALAGDGAVSGTIDDAANPTAAKPGELVFKEPKPEPNQADYSARTIF